MKALFDLEQIKSLMEDFYVLTHIKTALYDTDFQSLLEVPAEACALCKSVRAHPDGLLRCDLCTAQSGILSRKVNSVHIYKCHVGMTEAIAPLKIDDITVGYMMFGQLMEKDSFQENKTEVLENTAKYCAQADEALLRGIPVKSERQIRAASKLMETCISYIILNRLIQNNDYQLPKRVAAYVDEKINSDLDVSAMCEHFHIGRNLLYQISNEYFGMPIAKYIRRKRLLRAKVLLQSGMAVTEAAMQSGFRDYSHFTKAFKKEFGILPKSIKTIGTVE